MHRVIGTLLAAFFIAAFSLSAQQSFEGLPAGAMSSAHHEQMQQFGRRDIGNEAGWDSLNGSLYHSDAMQRGRRCSLGTSVVFGWNPYWTGTAYTGYDYSLLSDVCYFSYEVDPSTGGYSNIHSWKTTDLVPFAKAAGTRVHLCATLFANHQQLLGNTANRERLIDSLIALVRLRAADGVNIDFEGVPASQRDPLAGFMVDLGNRFHQELPGSRISIALPAVDWSNAFDVATMAAAVDLFIIMGYDYHWAGSSDAGPVAPKNSGARWTQYDATRSVNYYLAKGLTPAKLCLGVPYYGYEWPTAADTAGSAAQGTGTAVLYSTARAQAALLGRVWEPQSSAPYYAHRADSSWRVCFYDDGESLRMKYDMVKMKRLAGIGIWALGYDGQNPELWDAIRDVFTDCASSPCAGTFSDMGGPAGNYYADESYAFTIAPEGATSVTLAFNSFNVADDRLSIFDGRDTGAALIGRYSGTSSPGIVTGHSGALTLAFVSNGAVQSWGWTSAWACSSGPSAVTAAAAAPARLETYPNPATGNIVVRYVLPAPSAVRIAVYDLLGTEVMAVDEGMRERGSHETTIVGESLSAGTYLVQLQAPGFRSSAVVMRR
ncbi:MAG: T9SS type A sorting domain-containing protein [Bacteroidetes bacterium]|nr:T9SS type A sorting domain-containing protein [Bacteroidota bacterium]